MKFLVSLIFCAVLAGAQETKQPVTGSSTAPLVQSKVTPKIAKLQLKAYEAEQKASLRLAKAQTTQTLQQLKLQAVTKAYEKKLAVEQAKAQ